MMFYHSLRFKIHMIFLVAFLTLTLMIFFANTANKQRDIHIINLQAPYLKAIIKDTKTLEEVQKKLQNFDIKLVDKAVLKTASLLKSPRFRGKNIFMDKEQKTYYLKIQDYYLKMDNTAFKYQDDVTYALYSLLIFVLILYIGIMYSFKSLKQINKSLQVYIKNDAVINIRSEKKDEISILANAFQDAIDKNIALNNARRLFMRNILHELNTPITKGKLIATMLENEKLDSIFDALSSHIYELSQLEKITSYKYSLNIKEYPVQEIFENALDMLFLENTIETNFEIKKLKCDFYMMSLIFKNLIDNALKYGNDLIIFTKEREIVFESSGEKLKQDFSFYTQEFTKENENNQGLGLGLYIVNQTLKQQGFMLDYEFKESKNRFIIKMKTV